MAPSSPSIIQPLCTYHLSAIDKVVRSSILETRRRDLINTFPLRCYLVVPDAIFIVKFNTGLKYVWKFHLSSHNLWQSCQIVDIDVSLDRSIEYFCNEVLDDDPGKHFHSEIQHPA